MTFWKIGKKMLEKGSHSAMSGGVLKSSAVLSRPMSRRFLSSGLVDWAAWAMISFQTLWRGIRLPSLASTLAPSTLVRALISDTAAGLFLAALVIEKPW